MILLRYLLIIIIGFLISRAFVRSEKEQDPVSKKSSDIDDGGGPAKKVSKNVGEYVDYEEIKKKEK